MIFRPSREPGSDRHLELRALLLLTGAGLGLAGMLRERSWLIFAGMAVLLAGLVVRLINRRQHESNADDEQ